jgi:hypothetical protein
MIACRDFARAFRFMNAGAEIARPIIPITIKAIVPPAHRSHLLSEQRPHYCHFAILIEMTAQRTVQM